MQKIKLTKKYDKYPEYKDSGVEWLGKIPKNWNIKFVSRIKPGFAFSSDDYSEDGAMLVRITEVKSSIEGVAKKYLSMDLYDKHKDFRVYKNDLLISMTGYVGETALFPLDEPALLNQRVGKILANPEINSRYLYYSTKHGLFKIFLSFESKSSAQENVSDKDIGRYCLALPDIKLQTKIASYLDEKISSVDQIIEKKQRLIELLCEKRDAAINYGVRFDDEKMEKLKYLAPERKTKIEIAPVDVKYIGLENIEGHTGKLVDSTEKSEPESSVDIFKKDDVLFGKLRPYLAKVFVPDFDGVCSGEFLTLVPKTAKIIPRFLFYKLISKDFIKKVNDSTYGTKMPRANWQFIGTQMVSYPSLDEQRKIIKLLDYQMDIFERLTLNINRSIEILQEFKVSLISNLVTGKIRIN